ncbi:hypothetical protein J2S34_001020 [Nitrobacter winogradskyi]|uniref:Uncharacterized protein n=1 Tax=Nitrobacter winogradskyi TaxID=913 RepID=A0ACC6AFI2_NITWI|nr:hypothetical protein [Nitrobacter winogradskyi]
MPGPVPGIHVFRRGAVVETWVVGTSRAITCGRVFRGESWEVRAVASRLSRDHKQE